MAPLSTFTLLSLAASVLALPHTGQSGYGFHFRPTGTHFKASGTGVKSHHLPSGTRASSGVRVHSSHRSHSVESVVISTIDTIETVVPAKYNSATSETESCSTVTTKVRVTVTVTAEESSSVAAVSSPIAVVSSSAAAASSSVVAVSSSSSSSAALVSSAASIEVAPTIASYFAPEHVHSSSKAAAESSSTFSVQHTTSTAYSTTSYANKAHTPVVSLPLSVPSVSIPAIIPTTTAHTYLTASTVAASAYSAATTASASGQGKRGLAYNTASLASPFIGSQKVTWAYNWASSSSGLSKDFNYIPTLWGNASMFTDSWVKNAGEAIKSGSTHLFSFNEPDLQAQANLIPADAAKHYKEWMSDQFGSSGAKLCAPSVTNGYDKYNETLIGLEWLKSFLIQCHDCKIDCINIHWYGDTAADLEKHVQDTIAVAGGREIWFTEFALNGKPSSDTVSSFLKTVMSYLDGVSQVAGYAYFMLDNGILSSGTTLNTAGSTYMSYTG